jgi:hypothetical protein
MAPLTLFRFSKKTRLSLLVTVVIILGPVVSLQITSAAPVFADAAFANTWNRVDKPVQDLANSGRGYTWGPPAPDSQSVVTELYNGKARRVQYFDKARMEINDPNADQSQLWYVTTGLLVKELVTGLRQEGDNLFTQYPGSTVQIAGDSNQFGANAQAPTYASFRQVGTFFGTENGTGQANGDVIISRLDKAGQVSIFNPPEQRRLSGYDTVTRHNIADVFVDFSNLSGPVWNGSQYVTGPVLYGNPVFVMGRPITEPYWITTQVAGVDRPVLVQLFERRVLTYTPSNPAGFKVEMGNVGQHYYRWRYVDNAKPASTPTPQASPTPTPPPTPTPAPVGVNALLNLYNLPQLDPYAQTYQVSSHDRSDGNHDYDNPLYGEKQGQVLFDEFGPGTIYRIWMTHTPFKPFEEIGNLQFYFDDEATPRINLPVDDFFSGKSAPFLTPLVGNAANSSGGYFSYVPVTYAKRLVIVATGRSGYYQITYQRYAPQTPVNSFTGREDYSQLLKIFSNPGVDPKPARPGRQNITGQGALNPSQPLSLSGVLNGPAVISSFKLTMQFTDRNIVAKTFIRIQWDDRPTAQVDAPLDYFFGSGLNEKWVAGLMAGMNNQTHQYYFYFPMPFRRNARITLYNASANLAAQVNWEIGLDPDTNGQLVNANTGYFNATHKREVESPRGQDYKLLNANGRGRYVGTVLNAYSDASAIEGDERTYVDGSGTPHLYGTGFEDYFNAGYAFSGGTFSLPLHGSAYHDLSNEGGLTSMIGYRFLLGDAINFNSSISVGIEHGLVGTDVAEKNQVYTSLALWYGLDDSVLQPADTFDAGNGPSELSHLYSVTGLKWSGGVQSSYEGEKGLQRFSDNGHSLDGSSQFTLNINPNNAGVLIRRRLNYGDLNQLGRLYIDGQLVGLWFSPGQNSFEQWRDEDFLIPASYTKGKSSLKVRIEAIVIPSSWSEFYYTAYSIRPTQ